MSSPPRSLASSLSGSYVDHDRLNASSGQLGKLEREDRKYFDEIETLDAEFRRLTYLTINVAACQLPLISDLVEKPAEERDLPQVSDKLRAALANTKEDSLVHFRKQIDAKREKDSKYFTPEKVKDLMRSFTTALEDKLAAAEQQSLLTPQADLSQLTTRLQLELKLAQTRCRQILTETKALEDERAISQACQEAIEEHRQAVATATEASDIYEACAMGDLAFVNRIIEEYFWPSSRIAFLNKKNPQGFAPLHLAAMQRQWPIVSRLLEKGADPLQPHPNGNLAIHFVAAAGDIPTARELLQKNKESVKAKGEDQKTPLHLACANGHDKMAEFLIGEGADFNAKTEGEFPITPLSEALTRGHGLVVAQLTGRSDLMLHGLDAEGRSFLFHAVGSGSFESAELIVGHHNWKLPQDAQSLDHHLAALVRLFQDNRTWLTQKSCASLLQNILSTARLRLEKISTDTVTSLKETLHLALTAAPRAVVFVEALILLQREQVKTVQFLRTHACFARSLASVVATLPNELSVHRSLAAIFRQIREGFEQQMSIYQNFQDGNAFIEHCQKADQLLGTSLEQVVAGFDRTIRTFNILQLNAYVDGALTQQFGNKFALKWKDVLLRRNTDFASGKSYFKLSPEYAAVQLLFGESNAKVSVDLVEALVQVAAHFNTFFTAYEKYGVGQTFRAFVLRKGVNSGLKTKEGWNSILTDFNLICWNEYLARWRGILPKLAEKISGMAENTPVATGATYFRESNLPLQPIHQILIACQAFNKIGLQPYLVELVQQEVQKRVGATESLSQVLDSVATNLNSESAVASVAHLEALTPRSNAGRIKKRLLKTNFLDPEQRARLLVKLKSQRRMLDLAPHAGELTRGLILKYLRKKEPDLLVETSDISQSPYFSPERKTAERVAFLAGFLLESLNKINPIFQADFVLNCLAPETAENELEEKIRRLMNCAAWGATFYDRQAPELARVFVAEFGLEYLTHQSPSDTQQPLVKEIKVLYAFFLSACQNETCILKSYSPEIIAGALHQYVKTCGSLHAAGKKLGDNLSRQMFNSDEKQFLEICEGLTIKALAKMRNEKARRADEDQQKPEFSGIVSVALTNPFSLVASLVPPFMRQLFPDYKGDWGEFEKALLAIAPLCNQLLATDDFEASVKRNAATLKFTVNTLMATSSTQHSNVLDFLKTIIQSWFMPSAVNPAEKTVDQTTAESAAEANALFRKHRGDEKVLEQIDMPPLPRWLLFGLPKLLGTSSLLDTLSWANKKFLSPLGIVGKAIKDQALQSYLFSYLDGSPLLTAEEKSAFKSNPEILKSLEMLTKFLFEVTPLWKSKHETAFYHQTLTDLIGMIKSPAELDQNLAAEKIHSMVTHFLKVDYAKYEAALLSVFEKLRELLTAR